jgi:hypothetical protein
MSCATGNNKYYARDIPMSVPHREFPYFIDFSRFFNTPEGITTEET